MHALKPKLIESSIIKTNNFKVQRENLTRIQKKALALVD